MADSKKITGDKAAKGCLLTFLCMILLCAVCPIIMDETSEPENPNAWKNEDAGIMAAIMLEDFIKPYLKAPTTAKFPRSCRSITPVIKAQEYHVKGCMDSQNSFGAMIRGNYYGVIKQTKKENWKLLTLTINDKTVYIDQKLIDIYENASKKSGGKK